MRRRRKESKRIKKQLEKKMVKEDKDNTSQWNWIYRMIYRVSPQPKIYPSVSAPRSRHNSPEALTRLLPASRVTILLSAQPHHSIPGPPVIYSYQPPSVATTSSPNPTYSCHYFQYHTLLTPFIHPPPPYLPHKE